jgi:ornithine cyclodeaminase
VPDSPNLFGVMPAYSKALGALGAKLISVYPGNHGTSLDSHQGAVMLFDGSNGSPVALMDAVSITAIRTAAVSGVATRVLARRDARTLAILGSGVQARTHVQAMLGVRRFERIVIWSRRSEHAEALAREVSRPGLQVDAVRDAREAVAAADVVCTVTAAREPVLSGSWLRSGTHVNAVGAALPTMRELDSEAVVRARLFVDRRESALNEAGEVLIPLREGVITPEHIIGEIGEVLIGRASGRERDDDVTLFKSLGLAVEDLACAHFLHDRARRDNTGTWVDL